MTLSMSGARNRDKRFNRLFRVPDRSDCSLRHVRLGLGMTATGTAPGPPWPESGPHSTILTRSRKRSGSLAPADRLAPQRRSVHPSASRTLPFPSAASDARIGGHHLIRAADTPGPFPPARRRRSVSVMRNQSEHLASKPCRADPAPPHEIFESRHRDETPPFRRALARSYNSSNAFPRCQLPPPRARRGRDRPRRCGCSRARIARSRWAARRRPPPDTSRKPPSTGEWRRSSPRARPPSGTPE